MKHALKYWKKGEDSLRSYLQSIRLEDLEKLHRKIIDTQLGRDRILFGFFAALPQKSYERKVLQEMRLIVENEITTRNIFRLKSIMEDIEQATPIVEKGLQEKSFNLSEYLKLKTLLFDACQMITEYNLEMDTVWNKVERK